MQEFQPDWIVAMGGGSPIDAAKAMWAFYEYPDVTFEDLCIPFNFPELRTKAKFCRNSVNIRNSNRSNSILRYYQLSDRSKIPTCRF